MSAQEMKDPEEQPEEGEAEESPFAEYEDSFEDVFKEDDESIATDQEAERDEELVAADELEQAKEEIVQLKDQLIRAVAETENVRRRAERDIDESNKYAVTAFAKDMVAVLENLMRATTSIPEDARQENESLNALGEGVDMTLRELIHAFERHGIERIYPIGEKFDHNLHQAVSQVEDPEAENGSIMQVLQAGYQIHNRLLQPAMVVVAKNANNAAVDTKA